MSLANALPAYQAIKEHILARIDAGESYADILGSSAIIRQRLAGQ